MDFSVALDALKRGHRVQRSGWNGKGMWLALSTGGTWLQIDGLIGSDLAPFIVMKTADYKFVPWLASQTDILADDWDAVPYREQQQEEQQQQANAGGTDLGEQAGQERQQTRGEFIVGKTFNPSHDPKVDDIKTAFAAVIDLTDTIEDGDKFPAPVGQERGRLKALARTHLEIAAMFAVKAQTKGT